MTQSTPTAVPTAGTGEVDPKYVGRFNLLGSIHRIRTGAGQDPDRLHLIGRPNGTVTFSSDREMPYSLLKGLIDRATVAPCGPDGGPPPEQSAPAETKNHEDDGPVRQQVIDLARRFAPDIFTAADAEIASHQQTRAELDKERSENARLTAEVERLKDQVKPEPAGRRYWRIANNDSRHFWFLDKYSGGPFFRNSDGTIELSKFSEKILSSSSLYVETDAAGVPLVKPDPATRNKHPRPWGQCGSVILDSNGQAVPLEYALDILNNSQPKEAARA